MSSNAPVTTFEQVSAEFWTAVRYAIQVYVPEGKGPFPGVVMASTGRNGPRHTLYQQLGPSYLLSRSDVDPKRVGMTGDSDGGGTLFT